MMRTALALLISATMLTGCGSLTDSFTFLERPDKPVQRIMPPNFKQEILSAIPSAVTNPRGIREAYYSDPVLDPKVGTYVSCVRLNARNSAGEYEGAKEYAAYYYDGHLNQFVTAPPDQCAAANYRPFPEAERLCTGSQKCS
jgi:hypothetical protein